ncbi:hypothetical protein [Umezawaea sp. Da 62-37]|uniref:hypothetical protein n=1 Tax=Umezawaea sp. Da 62-37 TaxID=3075927 RepID=UPI0028F72680|nr:hypothetical protein [Umezawaea sp. Da 62-37]WNV83695.1 hypothetical protein RM788_36765 [Umezawaea sp. Da 62-37]
MTKRSYSKFVIDRVNEAIAAGDRGDAKACRQALDHAVAEDPDGLQAMRDLADQHPGKRKGRR